MTDLSPTQMTSLQVAEEYVSITARMKEVERKKMEAENERNRLEIRLDTLKETLMRKVGQNIPLKTIITSNRVVVIHYKDGVTVVEAER